jgi:hypothetical protein
MRTEQMAPTPHFSRTTMARPAGSNPRVWRLGSGEGASFQPEHLTAAEDRSGLSWSPWHEAHKCCGGERPERRGRTDVSKVIGARPSIPAGSIDHQSRIMSGCVWSGVATAERDPHLGAAAGTVTRMTLHGAPDHGWLAHIPWRLKGSHRRSRKRRASAIPARSPFQVDSIPAPRLKRRGLCSGLGRRPKTSLVGYAGGPVSQWGPTRP